jgi:NADPH2:quinone reductase
MKACWYERQGSARDVLCVGEMPDPAVEDGEVRIRVAFSGINPGDVKKRQDAFGYGMPYPRVIPHSDGAGVIDAVGRNVPAGRVGQRVWCYGAQSYRAFGTAAEYVAVPSAQAVPLADDVSFVQGACLGIPGVTAHRAVHVAGPVAGRVLLVQGAAGAVGSCAVALGRLAGAHVLAAVRSEASVSAALAAGAHEVLRLDQSDAEGLISQWEGKVQHIVEVDFAANVSVDERLLATGGSVACFASGSPTPSIPFWPLLFKNISVHFIGSDDLPPAAKAEAAAAVNAALSNGWPGFQGVHTMPLAGIAEAHERLERGVPGRVVLEI